MSAFQLLNKNKHANVAAGNGTSVNITRGLKSEECEETEGAKTAQLEQHTRTVQQIVHMKGVREQSYMEIIHEGKWQTKISLEASAALSHLSDCAKKQKTAQMLKSVY